MQGGADQAQINCREPNQLPTLRKALALHLLYMLQCATMAAQRPTLMKKLWGDTKQLGVALAFTAATIVVAGALVAAEPVRWLRDRIRGDKDGE